MNIPARALVFVVMAISPCCWAPRVMAQDTPAATTALSEPISIPNTASSPFEKMATNCLETGGEYRALTNGFGSWSGGYVRGVLGTGKDILNGEVSGQHEFGDAGTYFALGDTHNFTANTYASLTLGSSAGAFFFPRFRGDAFVNQKWLERKQLITTIGFGYYAAKDPHRDRNFSLGTIYYFKRPWILEDGVRFNVSNPGGVFSPSAFVALTQGRNKQHYITGRVGYGQEAYQLIGPTDLLSSFRSRTVTITWRQWIGSNWGVNGVADYYGNPYYTRAGTTLGLFREF